MKPTRPHFRSVATPQTKDAPPKDQPPKDQPSGDGVTAPPTPDPRAAAKDMPPERGGYDGPEPTRYGDWQHKGRVTDF
ncbi:MAG: DUF1674 domain-containing protein [Alphaproteobacteria bacterium]|nr:DUF1674 domain-containing protein [Alphaproteobacteria bacterium]